MRFPEFKDEWRLHPTTDYFEFKNGLNPDAKRFGTGTKFISVMDILNNRYITYDKIISSVEPRESDLKEFGVNYGDVLFQRSSETLEDVGRANVYLDNKTALFGGFVIRGKKIGEYNPLFFRYLLSNPHVRKRIIVKGAGAQHFNIGQDGLSKVSIFVPTAKEQERIAKLLDLIDERIETQSRIIEKTKSLIKGLANLIMDNPSDCIKYLLGDLCEIKSGYSGNQLVGNNGLRVSRIETISNHHINLDRVGFVAPFEKSEEYKLNIGDILFSNINSVEYIGNTAYIDKDYSLYHGMNLLRLIPQKPIVSPFFLYCLLNTDRLKNHFKTICNKAVSQASINQTELSKTPLLLPDMPKQIQIANLFKLLLGKKEIELSYYTRLIKQKKYLLSKLFI